jgi:DNA polymerase I-like protein with 3'-5' exonuclease and polymerase domains
MRGQKDPNVQGIFNRDLFDAVDWDKPFPKIHDYEKRVNVLYKINEVEDLLNSILGAGDLIMAFDYETTGRKPFKPDHRIHYVGLSYDDNAYTFPLEKPNYWEDFTQKKVIRLWRRVLTWGAVMKIAHNVAFEDLWSVIRMGVRPRNLRWCTMNTAHIIDSRKYFTSLGFQAYINFGIQYKDETKPYLETDNDVEYNEIQNAPPELIMKRCGLDCLFTRQLYFKQKDILDKNPELERARAFYQRSIYTFNNMQQRGIPVNIDYFRSEYDTLETLRSRIDKSILNSSEANRFRAKTGRPINHNSGPDLRHLLFDILKYPPVKKTKKGEQESVDVEVLEKLDTPFTQKVLKSRRAKKIRDTYLAQFLREEHNGRIHPFFNLHIARTYRSSSSNPNVHNIPVREEDALQNWNYPFN